MTSLAAAVEEHLNWKLPLVQVLPLRTDGTHSWLTHEIDVLIDFDWRTVVGHGAQTFRHYYSLSNYVRAHRRRAGRDCALLLTNQDGTLEGLRTDFSSHDIFIVNITRYKGLRKSDVASAYFAGLSGAPVIDQGEGSDERIGHILDALKNGPAFEQWLQAHPEVLKFFPASAVVSSTSSELLIRELKARLKSLEVGQLQLLEELVTSEVFPTNLVEAATLMKRREVAQRFRDELERNEWNETRDWQPFFKENSWIFGHGLLYHFLEPVSEQVLTGGKDMQNTGGLVGDFAVKTASDGASYLAIVDIKVPGAKLLGSEYRNRCFGVHADLAGAVSQIIGLCDRWNREGSKQEENIARALEEGWYTAQPRGILVIGHCDSLDTPDKRRSFELFRRHLHGVEIITFDELCKRAEALVAVAQTDNALTAVGASDSRS